MERLLQELAVEDYSIQEEAFSSILQVLREFALNKTEHSNDQSEQDPFFPNDILFRVIKVSLSIKNQSCSRVIDKLFTKAQEKYLDFQFYCIRNFEKVIAEVADSDSASRVCDILLESKFPSENELSLRDTLIPCEKSSFRRISTFKAAYSNCWLTILPLLPPSKLKKFLSVLAKRILPNLLQPHLLADFLSAAYLSGGLNGVLALETLFILIRDYNLDFPSFYDRLYALLDREILRASYRARFFKIFHVLMSSTMVPAYVVAGILKRIVRLSLAAPPAAILWVVPFAYNVLLNHPSCRILIHREVPEGWVDPYNPEDPCLATCRAIESSLWEISCLETHVWPRIAKLPTVFREKFTRPPYNLDSIAEEIDGVVISHFSEEELSHRWSRRPPTQYSIPSTLF